MAEGQNRVLIGLPERLEKAKAAVFRLEQELNETDQKLQYTHDLLQALQRSDEKIFLKRLYELYQINDE